MFPEWSWPYLQENYTGPYLSDGRLQSSVAHGKAPPKSRLDQLSRAHDTAYALARNDADRRKADRVYYDATRNMSWFPRIAGDLVLYGNDPVQLFNGLAGLGANMGNGNGRERANRIRRESNQRQVYAPMSVTPVWSPEPNAPVSNPAAAATPPLVGFTQVPSGGSPMPPAAYMPNGTFVTVNGSSSEYSGGGGVLFSKGRRKRKPRPRRN